MTSTTTIEDIDHIRWIRFERRAKRNALTVDDIATIRTGLRDAPKDCRCIVFAGSNGDFSAGADVSSFSGESFGTLEVNHESVGQQMLREVRTAGRPTVAAIEGYCIGLAMNISALCDIRVASKSAKFSMPEVKIGLPVIGDAGIYAQYIGLARAKELLMFGGFYSAEEMDSWGFINKLTEVGGAEAAAKVYAEQFCELPPRTVAAQKRIFEAWLQLPPRDAHRVSVLEFAVTMAHPETAEWLKKFNADRQAKKKS